MTTRLLHCYPTPQVLAAAVASRLILTVADRLASQPVAHVVLTGGTVGIASLAAVADHPARDAVEWRRVHFWWGDERFLPVGDADRNDTQARQALLDALTTSAGLDDSTIHPMPSPDGGLSLDDAPGVYAAELAQFAGVRTPGLPDFDVLMLGMGPDGHVASLFPGHDTVHRRDVLVLAEPDSPKPPPPRVSLSFPAITSADEVWLVIAGAEKAAPAARAVAGGDISSTPAAGAVGRVVTRYLIDDAAAASR